MKREKLPKLRAGGNLGNASKKFSVFIRSCFTRCHFKIWNISFIAICHFHIWPEQLIFCADAAHKTNSVPVASNQAHNWTTRLIGVSTIFTGSINLIIVGQTIYCPNLGSRFASGWHMKKDQDYYFRDFIILIVARLALTVEACTSIEL